MHAPVNPYTTISEWAEQRRASALTPRLMLCSWDRAQPFIHSSSHRSCSCPLCASITRSDATMTKTKVHVPLVQCIALIISISEPRPPVTLTRCQWSVRCFFWVSKPNSTCLSAHGCGRLPARNPIFSVTPSDSSLIKITCYTEWFFLSDKPFISHEQPPCVRAPPLWSHHVFTLPFMLSVLSI